MGKRRFEMHEYRQIIVRLRLGETIRGLALTKLASRKKIRMIRQIAMEQKWLDTERDLPDVNGCLNPRINGEGLKRLIAA